MRAREPIGLYLRRVEMRWLLAFRQSSGFFVAGTGLILSSRG